jgi:endoglucanase Acf2
MAEVSVPSFDVGLGSFLVGPPAGAPTAPRPAFTVKGLDRPLPAGRWWTSAVWQEFSGPMYPHPLAVRACACGLEVDTPTVSVGTEEQFKSDAIVGKFAGDFTIAADGLEFEQALVVDHSDWAVRLLFASGASSLRMSVSHGSPFIYADCQRLAPMLQPTAAVEVWALAGPTIGFSINGHPYGAFLPTGAAWQVDNGAFSVEQSHAIYFSVAALPEKSEQVLSLFAGVAHNHVVSTRVHWAYDEPASRVQSTYEVELEPRDGAEDPITLMALYPHQWRVLDDAYSPALTDLGYDTVRGRMRVLRANEFATTIPFPGALPYMPALGNETEQLRTLVDQVAAEGDHHLTNLMPHAASDMYWTGVSLGRITALVPIAERVGATEAVNEFVEWLKRTLESHFAVLESDASSKETGFFWWDEDWSTVIGCPGGFGADTELNDHHYQYAYWIRAATEIARHDPDWIKPENWGGMVQLLVHDIATRARDDERFPFLRNFDLYAGHSWATGIQQWPDGANSESSSEAIAAWAAVLLWAELTGDPALRDFAAFLYATEISAADEYWFDVHRENFPTEFGHAMTGQVWGGKTCYSVWWTDDPEPMRGISFLPLTPTSFYLGRSVEYVRENLDDLRRTRPAWSYWPDILWCYEALADPVRAVELFDAADPAYTEGHSESRAHTLSWILDLLELGRVDATITADTSCYAVFRNDRARTYLAYNASTEQRLVLFSDNTSLVVAPRQAGFVRRAI